MTAEEVQAVIELQKKLCLAEAKLNAMENVAWKLWTAEIQTVTELRQAIKEARGE